MRLLDLAPEIQADIDEAHADRPMPSERQLRSLAGVRPVADQCGAYRRLLAVLRTSSVPRAASSRQSRLRRRGFQHLLVRARRFAALLEDDAAMTYTELGRRQGVSGARVGQLVLLLHLDPRILARIDVPACACPPGITEKSLRRIARLSNGEDQLTAFLALLPQQS